MGKDRYGIAKPPGKQRPGCSSITRKQNGGTSGETMADNLETEQGSCRKRGLVPGPGIKGNREGNRGEPGSSVRSTDPGAVIWKQPG